MKVTVLSHTPEPEKLVAAAARLCYSKISAAEILDNFTSAKADSFIQRLTDMGHMSPTEHVSFTFAIDGVSRSLLAQITRHRIASYSVQSLRYNNPFDAEVTDSQITSAPSLEDICFLEGAIFASKANKITSTPYNSLAREYKIHGKLPEDIPNIVMPAYLRGVFEICGIIKKSPKPIISFPTAVKPAINSFSFNTTQVEDKILIQNDAVIDFVKTIYSNLDFSESLYDQDRLAEVCNSIGDFFDIFVKTCKNYINSKFYATLPITISKNPHAILEYINGLESCKKHYINLVKMGVAQEDARYILPMGTQTRIVMTMNVRSLYNFFNLRCCTRAQSEIRQLANLMLAEVKKIAPSLFKKAGAPCEATGYCPEGKFSCGRYPVR
ncbi:MAG TPA: FAD-dependent thymidylate synthase [Thermoanaerobacterales bacterium]|nr:FAD-dependent thymidylate synthase [Thermoanaerobacterales bacterium]